MACWLSKKDIPLIVETGTAMQLAIHGDDEPLYSQCWGLGFEMRVSKRVQQIEHWNHVLGVVWGKIVKEAFQRRPFLLHRMFSVPCMLKAYSSCGRRSIASGYIVCFALSMLFSLTILSSMIPNLCLRTFSTSDYPISADNSLRVSPFVPTCVVLSLTT